MAAKFNVNAVRQVAKQNPKNNSGPDGFNVQKARAEILARPEAAKAQAYKHNRQLADLDRNLGPNRGGRGD